MNKCTNCGVYVYPHHKACPLCGEHFDDTEDDITAYPDYSIKVKMRRTQVKKTVLFFSLIICIVCFFINYFSWDKIRYGWSIILFAVIMSFLAIVFSILAKISTGAKLIIVYFEFIGIVFVIDLIYGFQKYSTTYVIPFSTVLLTAIFTILATLNRKNYRNYFGYLISVFFISLLPVAIFLLSLSQLAWTSFIAVLYSILTTIGLLFYSGRSFREEIKKKFHL